MLLSKAFIFDNVERLNQSNVEIGSHDLWIVDDSCPNWFRIYRKDTCEHAVVSSYDIERIFGSLSVPYLVSMDLYDGLRHLTISVHDSNFFDL